MGLSVTQNTGACIKSNCTGAKSCISPSYGLKLSKTLFSVDYVVSVLPFCFQTGIGGEIFVNLLSQYYAVVSESFSTNRTSSQLLKPLLWSMQL